MEKNKYYSYITPSANYMDTWIENAIYQFQNKAKGIGHTNHWCGYMVEFSANYVVYKSKGDICKTLC